MRVVDEGGREQPWDGAHPGEIQTRGPMVLQAYYRVLSYCQHVLKIDTSSLVHLYPMAVPCEFTLVAWTVCQSICMSLTLKSARLMYILTVHRTLDVRD